MRHYKGKVIKYEDRFITPSTNILKVQKVVMEDGGEKAQVFMVLTKWHKEHGVHIYSPSYKELKTILDILIEINGKEEVERELNIKIK